MAFLTFSALAAASPAFGTVAVRDDSAGLLTLAQPARRIVALSPQLVELAIAAGARQRLVGAVAGSDWPPAARALPRVGDAFGLNLEAIVQSHPDLILAWRGGTPERQVGALRHLGIPVYWSQTETLDDIASTVRRIGTLAGTQPAADAWARAFDGRLRALRARYARQTPVRVFDQIWPAPLLTAGGPQLATEAIATCGGVNPFAALPLPAPQVSREAVLQANPQLIVAATADPHALQAWRAFPQIDAVRHRQLVVLDPRWLPRMGADVLDGVEQLCRAVDAARAAAGR